jgi:hypothetical protein
MGGAPNLGIVFKRLHKKQTNQYINELASWLITWYNL